MTSERRQPTSTGVVPIELLTSVFLRFAKLEAAGGILLLVSTIVALVWANSPWSQTYYELWNTQVSIGFGRFSLSETRLEWINDGLMSIFFFLVGLEIKREALIGELSSVRQAAFPFVAALGGTIVPALIYVLVTHGNSDAQKGWGIPMATDIAFALGVLALLGRRVPVSLKIFVTALAIVDDIVGVLVIATFYTEGISLTALFASLAGVAVSYLANRLGVRRPMVYALIGLIVWVATLKSGVHATIAGILLAFTIPTDTYLGASEFLERGRPLLERIASCAGQSEEEGSNACQGAAPHLEKAAEQLQQPLYRIEHLLQPWVTFLIMPVFPFANAGVPPRG